MSALEKSTHIHEYERSKENKEVYRCKHPKCTHYQRREFLEGKEALCFKCKNPFILSWTQLRNKRPVCDFCTKSPRSVELRAARDLALKSINLAELPDELADIILDSTLE